MKCPYQTKTIHKPARNDGYITRYAEDTTCFIECFKDECPFYHTALFTVLDQEPKTIKTEHCRKAEIEVFDAIKKVDREWG